MWEKVHDLILQGQVKYLKPNRYFYSNQLPKGHKLN